eukprot:1844715-Amphidinium_carterae.4
MSRSKTWASALAQAHRRPVPAPLSGMGGGGACWVWGLDDVASICVLSLLLSNFGGNDLVLA